MAELERQWLKQLRRLGYPESGWHIIPLKGDGSDRRFVRLINGTQRFVGVHAPRKATAGMDENDSYWLIGKLLAECDLPVPRFYAADIENGFFLLEDLGDLQDYVLKRSFSSRTKIYRRVLKLLVRLHRVVPPRFGEDLCFDEAIYSPSFIRERELEYFRCEFINGFLAQAVDSSYLASEFQELAEVAGVTSTEEVIHRDFQSRNLMIHKEAVRLIDFQGMRFGPGVYDLASLLADPYVGLHPRLQDDLAEAYRRATVSSRGAGGGDFWARYQTVRLCRHLQILGAFGFLIRRKGKVGFAPYVAPAWNGLVKWLDGAVGERFPRLKACVVALQLDPDVRSKIFSGFRKGGRHADNG